MATRAQLAWRKKFAEKYGRKKKTASRPSPKKVNKLRSKSRIMAQRFKSRRVSRRGVRRGLGGARNIFTKLSSGIGGGLIAQEVANRVYPAASPVAGLAGSFLAGGVYGVAGKVAFDAITGGGFLGGLLGGLGGGSTQPAMVEAV